MADLNSIQFGVPAAFGTRPVPRGMVRFNHYTSSEEAARGIEREGLLRSKSEESYARGATESPQVFMTAGPPSEDLLRTAPVIEGWADPSRKGGQLDIGENWRDTDPVEHAAYLEQRRSTITARGDIPPNQVMATHLPWHQNYRYFVENKLAPEVWRGEYDDFGDSDVDTAVSASKVASIAGIMVGGKAPHG